MSTIKVFQQNTPSVVNITNLRTVQARGARDVQLVPAGTGSGFIWDDKGGLLGTATGCSDCSARPVAGTNRNREVPLYHWHSSYCHRCLQPTPGMPACHLSRGVPSITPRLTLHAGTALTPTCITLHYLHLHMHMHMQQATHRHAVISYPRTLTPCTIAPSSPPAATGHVVTNYHVIRGASEVKVTLLDQSSYTARVVGADEAKDVAVLQLEGGGQDMGALRPVVLGRSGGLQVGGWGGRYCLLVVPVYIPAAWHWMGACLRQCAIVHT